MTRYDVDMYFENRRSLETTKVNIVGTDKQFVSYLEDAINRAYDQWCADH